MGLLPGHGDAEAFFGADEVVVVVGAEIDLDPVDRARRGTSVRRNRRSRPSLRTAGCEGGCSMLDAVPASMRCWRWRRGARRWGSTSRPPRSGWLRRRLLNAAPRRASSSATPATCRSLMSSSTWCSTAVSSMCSTTRTGHRSSPASLGQYVLAVTTACSVSARRSPGVGPRRVTRARSVRRSRTVGVSRRSNRQIHVTVRAEPALVVRRHREDLRTIRMSQPRSRTRGVLDRRVSGCRPPCTARPPPGRDIRDVRVDVDSGDLRDRGSPHRLDPRRIRYPRR